MITEKIYLGNIENAISFVNILDKSNARIHIKDGSYDLDAKSLLCVLSRRIDKPLTLEINGDEKEQEKVCLSISDFIAS